MRPGGENRRRLLLDAVFRHPNHFLAELPYNLNWAVRLGRSERDYLDAHRLVVCDVGARYQAPAELRPFFRHMRYHAFEADKAECERLTSSRHPYAEMHVFPYFVGDRVGTADFHLCRRRSLSSLYRPSARFRATFGGDEYAVDETVPVESTTLDVVHAERMLPAPDFLKLDTQGSELDVLRHATDTMRETSMLQVEVEFVEMYEGQPLFHDVTAFLHARGFELLYLNRSIVQRRVVYTGPARGQVVFADALFGRRDDLVGGLPSERLVKYALLLINYGHLDVAHQLLSAHPEVRAELPSIDRYFRSGHGSLLRRAAVSQVDKLAMLWLHARRYNQLNGDSDRSWPFR